MIVVWTANGGPLQHFGVFLVILFQVLPVLFPHLTSSDSDEAYLQIVALACILAFGILAGIIYLYRNMVIEIFRSIQQRLSAANMFALSPHLIVFGALCGIVSGALMWWIFQNKRGQNPHLYGISNDAYTMVMSLIQLIGFGCMIGSSILRYQQGHNGGNRARQKLEKIMSKIRQMPIEEFCKNDKESYSSLSISQLQDMLRARGMLDDGDNKRFLERSDLVSALEGCRKYADTCCICYEEYQEGKHLLRIFPKCHHEFHVECLDQWAYTFRHKQAAPTCPLCKTSI